MIDAIVIVTKASTPSADIDRDNYWERHELKCHTVSVETILILIKSWVTYYCNSTNRISIPVPIMHHVQEEKWPHLGVEILGLGIIPILLQ